ncbi:MAG: PAS domain S-box protein [Oligoflexia bacterium]|nr:PAS domain S-box protein [Oligoflexia bacterium]
MISNILITISLITFVINFFLGILVYTQNKFSKINNSYAFFSLIFAVWSILDVTTWLPFLDINLKLLLMKFATLFWIPIGLLLLNFFYTLLDIKKGKFYPFGLTVLIVVMLLSLLTDLCIKDMVSEGGTIKLQPGGLFYLAILIASVPAFRLIAILFYEFRNKKADVITKNAIIIILFSIFIAIVFTFSINFLPYLLHNKVQVPIGAATLSFVPLVIFFCVSKYLLGMSSEESLSRLLNRVKDIIVFTDTLGYIIQLNETAKELFGLSVKDYSSTNMVDFIRKFHPEFELERENTETHDTDISLSVNGNIKTFLVSVSKTSDRRGPQGYIFILKDITDIKISEAELKTVILQLKKEMEQKARMQKQAINTSKLVSLGILASGISHEINNPLMIIYGNLSLMRDYLEARENKDEYLINSLDKQEYSIKRIGTILEGLRTYARVEKETEGFVDVHQIITQTTDIVKGIFESKGININLILNADKTSVNGDSGEFRQVIMNLVQNAFDAFDKCPENKKQLITIETRNMTKEIIINVSDTGCGIPEENLGIIFDTFFTTKDPHKGTGLGLSITQSIIFSMKGSIDVESQLGSGTTFTIKLPVIS